VRLVSPEAICSAGRSWTTCSGSWPRCKPSWRGCDGIMSNTLRRTARHMLATARALAPLPARPDPCPRCGAPDLAAPCGELGSTLLDWSAGELRLLLDTLGRGPCPPGGWKARLMWCPQCKRLVPVGRYKQGEWGPGFIGGCSAEEAGPEMQRNYMDAHLVHD